MLVSFKFRIYNGSARHCEILLGVAKTYPNLPSLAAQAGDPYACRSAEIHLLANTGAASRRRCSFSHITAVESFQSPRWVSAFLMERSLYDIAHPTRPRKSTERSLGRRSIG
jgi:hypothetical protein